MIISGAIGIIADDLTGANDTALQFFLKGCDMQIILDENADFENFSSSQGLAISTESRNIPSDEAIERIKKVGEIFTQKLNVEHFYKKIDSTLRGNIGVEIFQLLEELNKDCAVIAPAFPAEGRITIGGYHLLKGVPIERTEMARDPLSPIYESYIPTILKQGLGQEFKDLIGQVDFKTVVKGAGPIVMEFNRFIEAGKKLIVVDAVSTEDMGQIALACQKCAYDVLPCGSAGLANALGNIWLDPASTQLQIKNKLPKLPKLILSGSATKLSASQIKKLEQEDDYSSYFVPLKAQTVLDGLKDEFVQRILSNLKEGSIVCVHSSGILSDSDEDINTLIDAKLTHDAFSGMITDFLSELAQKIVSQKDVILITIGGETSYKCANATGSKNLRVIDAVAPAIPLCVNTNDNIIVTKSGNLGVSTTLIDIMKYFEGHE